MGPSLDCFVLTAAMRDARDIGLLVTVCRVERLQIPPLTAVLYVRSHSVVTGFRHPAAISCLEPLNVYYIEIMCPHYGVAVHQMLCKVRGHILWPGTRESTPYSMKRSAS